LARGDVAIHLIARAGDCGAKRQHTSAGREPILCDAAVVVTPPAIVAALTVVAYALSALVLMRL